MRFRKKYSEGHGAVFRDIPKAALEMAREMNGIKGGHFMKAKRIFRGALAGLVAASLMVSGTPVAAAELDTGMQQELGIPSESGRVQQEGILETKEQAGFGAGEEAGGGIEVQSAGEIGNGEQSGDGSTDNNENKGGTQGGNQAEDSAKENDNGIKDAESIEGADSMESQTELIEEVGGAEMIENGLALFTKHPVAEGSISIDGSLSDWAGVAPRPGAGVDAWKAAISPDGNTVYFCYSGTASTEWDYSFAGSSYSFQFAYADGVAGADNGISVNAWKDGAEVKDGYWGNIPGAEAAVTNEAHGNNPGPYTVEFAVPANFFHSMDAAVTFGGTSVAFSEIEQVDGNPAAADGPAVYAGISVDGDFSDWEAVAKTDVSCPNSEHPGCLSSVAAVFDGDWFYLYVKDGKGSNASGAGTHSNGKFAITSDLGYETDIQFSTAPAINGVDGAKVAYIGSQWEVAIPKGQLPKYRESLSFGLYLGEPFLTGIVNLQPDGGNNLENLFAGIIYDGQYEDWEDYGHSTIQYATAGSQEAQVDAKGALYSDGGRMYGHVVTTMPQHLQEACGEFTAAVTVAFNQSPESLANGSYDQKMAFYPRFVTVDAGGDINWDPQLSGLSEGTYEFFIASADAWHTSANIGNLNEMDQMYGKMMVTVGRDGKDEMEFYLDLPMVAKKLGVDETALREISAQFGRIGQQWIYTAGTSTGAVAGVAVCMVAVGVGLWFQRKKKGLQLAGYFAEFS